MNVLFICSMNKWRSPTAESLYRKVPGLSVRSAGTSRKARRTVSFDDICWADLICVMEDKHASRLRSDFRDALSGKRVVVLDIPDDYQYMDPELIDLLTDALSPIL